MMMSLKECMFNSYIKWIKVQLYPLFNDNCFNTFHKESGNNNYFVTYTVQIIIDWEEQGFLSSISIIS